MVFRKALFWGNIVVLILGFMGFGAYLLAQEEKPSPPPSTTVQEVPKNKTKYVVVFPEVPLRNTIPVDEDDESNTENIKEILVKYDIVKRSESCEPKGSHENGDWLCVEFVRHGNRHKERPKATTTSEPKDKEGKGMGWVFRYSVREQTLKKTTNQPYDQEWTLYTQDFAPYTTVEKNTDKVSSNLKSEKNRVETIRKACENANIKCNLKTKNWKKAQEDVASNEAEGLFFIGGKPRKYLLLSPPLYEDVEYGFFTNPDSKLDKNDLLNSLANEKVTAYGSYSSTCYKLNEEVIKKANKRLAADKKIPLVKCEEETTTADVFKKLIRERVVTVVFSNKLVGDRAKGEVSNPSFEKEEIKYIQYEKDIRYYVGIRATVDSEAFFDELDKLLGKDESPNNTVLLSYP